MTALVLPSVLLGVSRTMSCEPRGAGWAPSNRGPLGASEAPLLEYMASTGRVRIGTWNVSGWSLLRAGVVSDTVKVDILAV